MIKKLSQQFISTKSQFLGALSNLGTVFLNPQVRAQSGTVPEKFGNSDFKNQESNEDPFQNDPRRQVGTSI